MNIPIISRAIACLLLAGTLFQAGCGGGSPDSSSSSSSSSGSGSVPAVYSQSGGTISVTGGTMSCSGQNSPCLYSTGSITASGLTCSSTGAEMAVVEGSNSITLTNTSLSSSKADKWGVMIYQSMSGDATGTNGTFTMTGGSLSYTSATGPLFYVTNSTGNITVTGATVSAGSGILIKAASGDWGTSGSNGGTVVFTADGETLAGNLVADSISSITAVLQNGTSLTGAIDSAHTAGTANLTLDATSAWTVTANSYLTCLSDTSGISGTSISNITGNSYIVYYKSSSCSALGGLTYSLAGGGTLQPE